MKIDFVSSMGLMVVGLLFGLIVGDIVQKSYDESTFFEGFISVKNESIDWYWLEDRVYIETQLTELYTLKNILISNECVDGGFIENIDGEKFMIVCYERKKMIENG